MDESSYINSYIYSCERLEEEEWEVFLMDWKNGKVVEADGDGCIAV